MAQDKKAKREAAIKRQEKYNALSKDQKIAKARERPGESKKELKKLESL